MPAKPIIHATIFFIESFSCLKKRQDVIIAKNEEEPERMVPFSPVVFARPT